MRKSVVWNVIEVIASSVVLFIVYRLVISRLGVTALGVWSLVLSTTSIARVADLGAVGGLARFVARGRAASTASGAMPYVQTAYALNLILYSGLALLIIFPAWFLLGKVAHGESVIVARQLLPYSIASFALMNLSAVSTATLTAYGRGDIKSRITLCALLVQATLSLTFIGSFGLVAIAMAQIAQYLIVLFGGWVAIRRLAREDRESVRHNPFIFHKAAARDLVGFGARLQMLNLAAFLFDPATKFVLTSVCGLQVLGLFELASRTVLQVRLIIVTPGQNLPPLYASTLARKDGNLEEVVHETTAMTVSAGGALLGLVAFGSPLVSYIWLGHLDVQFLIFLVALCMGWFCNLVSTPGYYLGIASGQLRGNIIGALLTTVCAPLLIWPAQLLAGPTGVAIVISVCIAIGALFTARFNLSTLRISARVPHDVWCQALDSFRRLASRKTSTFFSREGNTPGDKAG